MLQLLAATFLDKCTNDQANKIMANIPSSNPLKGSIEIKLPMPKTLKNPIEQEGQAGTMILRKIPDPLTKPAEICLFNK